MDDVAVTRIKDQNFEVLSCEEVAGFKGDKAFLKEKTIKRMLKPLLKKNYDDNFIQNAEAETKDFLLKIVKKADGISDFDFKSKKENYKALFHKMKPLVFGFLLRALSPAEMEKIERQSVAKTYLAGDTADIFVKKDSMH